MHCNYPHDYCHSFDNLNCRQTFTIYVATLESTILLVHTLLKAHFSCIICDRGLISQLKARPSRLPLSHQHPPLPPQFSLFCHALIILKHLASPVILVSSRWVAYYLLDSFQHYTITTF